ncbi:MAG: VCBS repeat-containing protein [Archangiaceae bacterium]|nr:VCBS repeat-containing protein [Archangiaceae bacterium]
MRSTLLVTTLLAGCGVAPDAVTRSAADQALAGGCTTPLNCPGGPVQPPPVDPHPIDCADVTGTLTASQTSVRLGAPVVLAWSVVQSSCNEVLTLSGEPVSRAGALTVPAVVDTVSLQLGTRVLARVDLAITVPSVVRIGPATAAAREVFIYAVKTANTKVLLQQDLELDLSWRQEIAVAGGVSIESERLPLNRLEQLQGTQRPTARDSNHLGPRLFSTTLTEGHLLVLKGDDITLRGFRLEGPDQGISDKLGSGVTMNARKNIEIDNLEVSGWGSSGISMSNEALWPGQPYEVPSRVTVPDDIWIHDCFIHHNQHAPGGFGYGICVGTGARARVEHNVFDFNRHSLTSDGHAGVEYVAFENLILKGGGYHETDTAGITWTTHSFDVHGDDDCWIIGDKNCGNAGFQYLVERNAFQYSAGNAFKLRGTPVHDATLKDNVFAHPTLGSAVDKTTHAPDPVLIGNTVGLDTFGQYGVCDFDGDGYDDLFLATGRTWWFASGGRLQWTFLASRDDQLASLRFGDFDRDGKCDVFRAAAFGGWQIATGGTGQWARLPGGNAFPLDQLAFHDFDADGFTDIFRRDPNGQWLIYDTRTGAPRSINSSSAPMSGLRFADFDADGRTDVAAVVGGVWKWSRSGTALWAVLNPRYSDLTGVISGSVDAQPGDDLVRRTELGAVDSLGNASWARFQISSGGRGPWVDLVWLRYPAVSQGPGEVYFSPTAVFSGRFSLRYRDSLLAVPLDTRAPLQFSWGQSGFVLHSFYEY